MIFVLTPLHLLALHILTFVQMFYPCKPTPSFLVSLLHMSLNLFKKHQTNLHGMMPWQKNLLLLKPTRLGFSSSSCRKETSQLQVGFQTKIDGWWDCRIPRSKTSHRRAKSKSKNWLHRHFFSNGENDHHSSSCFSSFEEKLAHFTTGCEQCISLWRFAWGSIHETTTWLVNITSHSMDLTMHQDNGMQSWQII